MPCGSGLCTPLDPVDPTDPSRVLLNGNPFPRAPETTYNFNLRYTIPLVSGKEVFFHTDWAWWGKDSRERELSDAEQGYGELVGHDVGAESIG